MAASKSVRTTVTLAPDVAAAVAETQRREGRGVSAVVNDLVRRALVTEGARREPFVQRTSKMGLLIDVRNVQEALDIAEGPWRK